MTDIEDIDTFDLTAPEFDDGLYRCEVKRMGVVYSEKSDARYHVIQLEIVDEGPYKGTQVAQWVPVVSDTYNKEKMNKARLLDFMIAVTDETDIEPKIKYQRDDENNLYLPSVEGMEVGAYLKQSKGYINVDNKGFVPVSELNDEKPF